MPEWVTFSNMASVASILGLGISVYVLIVARRIEKYYIFRIRSPELLSELKQHTSRIQEPLETSDQSVDEIQTETTQCSAVLKSLKSKPGRAESEAVSRTIKLITRHQKRYGSSRFIPHSIGKVEAKNQTWNIYQHLLLAHDELRHLSADYKLK